MVLRPGGHHRSWYRTDDGVCYDDVRDDTNDQLYKPERAEVKVRQLNAIEATWGLTLRKNGRFFLTGYLYGDDVPCAQDANGWKIFERSVVDCAEKGWDRQHPGGVPAAPDRVHLAHRRSAGSGDTVAPEVQEPASALRDKGSLSGKAVTVSWSGSDTESGVARYDLEQRIDGGAWDDVALARADSTQAGVGVRNDRTYRFRVRAKDSAGNWSDYSAGSAFTTAILQARRTTLSGGTWHSSQDPTASGGATQYAKTSGAKASVTFTGRGVAIIAPQGPRKGTARILIDGQDAGVIDLSAPEKRAQRIVFSRTWETAATRTIELVLVGDERVDLDAVLVIS